jgi:hypothetical protein
MGTKSKCEIHLCFTYSLWIYRFYLGYKNKLSIEFNYNLKLNPEFIYKLNVFHVRALYYTKTLITNKCTKRVLSSIVKHSYMFRPCWFIFRENFFVIVNTKVALYSWVRMCCWLCTALFLEAWTPRGAQKVSDLGGFRISEFRIRDIQPVI